MAGNLTHAPCWIIRQLLIDLGYGTNHADGLAWPVFAFTKPDSPDSCITVYDTTSQKDGRHMVNGEVQEHYGIQIAVRAQRETIADPKARAIAVALDQEVNYTAVTVESSQYSVREVTRISGPIPGKEIPETKRALYTINVIAPIRQIV